MNIDLIGVGPTDIRSHTLRSAKLHYIDAETCINDTLYSAVKSSSFKLNVTVRVTQLREHMAQDLAEFGNSIICAKVDTQFPCNGDSGGPLLRTKGGKLEIVGVASFTNKMCNTSTETKYTNISKYYDWIQKTVQDVTGNGSHTKNSAKDIAWIVVVVIAICGVFVTICGVLALRRKRNRATPPVIKDNVYTEINDEHM